MADTAPFDDGDTGGSNLSTIRQPVATSAAMASTPSVAASRRQRLRRRVQEDAEPTSIPTVAQRTPATFDVDNDPEPVAATPSSFVTPATRRQRLRLQLKEGLPEAPLEVLSPMRSTMPASPFATPALPIDNPQTALLAEDLASNKPSNEDEDAWQTYKRAAAADLFKSGELTEVRPVRRVLPSEVLLKLLFSAGMLVTAPASSQHVKRFLADEGFFVGKPPEVLAANLLRLEQRLRVADPSAVVHFLGDGRIARAADPLRPNPLRMNKRMTVFQTVCLRLPPAIRAKYRLDVSVGRLAFTVHPLCIAEHGLAAQLVEAVAAHVRALPKNDPLHYRQRLAALEEALHREQPQLATIASPLQRSGRHLPPLDKPEPVDAAGRLDSLHLAVEQARQQLVTAEAAVAERMSALVAIWNKLKRVREAQGCASTRVQLVLHKRAPGDEGPPIPELREADITPHDKCPLTEQQRRIQVMNQKIYARLLVNDQAVDRSPAKTMDASCGVELAHVFKLQLVAWPRSVSIQLYQDGIVDTLLATVPIRVADSGGWDISPFLGDTTFIPPILGATPLRIAGVLRAMGRWVVGDAKLPPPPPPLVDLAAIRLDALNDEDSDAVVEQTGGLRDPNDPRIGSIIRAREFASATRANLQSAGLFRIVNRDHGVSLPPTTAPRRQYLLTLRSTRPEVFNDAVPVNDAFVDAAMYMQTRDAATQKQVDDEISFTERVRSQRVVKQLQQRRTINVHDVVRQPILPDIRLTFDAILEFLRPRRRLNPFRRERAAVSTQPKNCAVLAQIVRAYNVPVRANSDAKNVRPVVRLRFQNATVFTRPAEGADPEFGDSLQLPFTPPAGDFSPTALAAVADELRFDLYDQLVFEEKDERFVGTRKERIELRWLAGFSLPFSTLYSQGTVGGTFAWDQPMQLIGYTSNGPTLLSVHIVLDPPLLRPPPMRPTIGQRSDARDLMQYALTWERQIRSKNECRDRNIQVTATEMSGASRIITRYIAPLPPPHGVDTEMAALRFVSLIPFLSDRVALPGWNGIWSTHREFLEIGAGDWEEHALLLCGLLLHMHLDAWVVLGTAVPEGPVAWVLTTSHGSLGVVGSTGVKLWNPAAGRIYAPGERACPLQSIGIVFNASQVYANVQPNVRLGEISFTFHEPRYWVPLFTDSAPQRAPPPLQPPELAYSPADIPRAKSMETSLESAIQKRIEALRRPRAPTKWHSRAANAKLRSLLDQYELARASGTSIDDSIVSQTLGRIAETCDVVGVPINIPFTDSATAIDAAISIGVHDNYSPGVEFALAVLVSPFPSGVFSVWAYIAALVPKR